MHVSMLITVARSFLRTDVDGSGTKGSGCCGPLQLGMLCPMCAQVSGREKPGYIPTATRSMQDLIQYLY